MDTLIFFIHGIITSFEPYNIFIMLVGLALGIIGGMLPGINSVSTLALFIPFTFSMPPATALIALGSIYMGATYGGSIAAILINTPGQPASLATALEGYEMTKKGESRKALDTALIASAYGGVFGGLMLLFFFKPLSAAGLLFGSEAFFWLGVLGMSALATLYPGNVMRSLLAGLIGMALSTVGMDITSGMPRFTMDIPELAQGFDMVVLMIGIFSVTQMFTVIESNEEQIVSSASKSSSLWQTTKDIFGRFSLLNGCSLLGTFIGILPGAGGTVAAIMAYNEAKRFSKSPERYGKGFIDGIIAPESANNASVGGALVPLLSLGIPGSAAAAVIVGGLMAQGISPGPQLLSKSPDIAFAFIASISVCAIVMIPCGWLISRCCVRLLDLPSKIIIPAVITLSCIGTFALRNSMFDVGVMLMAGGVGYILHKASIPAGSIALGLVLGPIVEENLVITMLRSRSSSSLFDLLIFSPLAFFLMICCLLMLCIPVILEYFNNKNNNIKNNIYISFNKNSIFSYNFIIIFSIIMISIPLLVETLTFNKEGMIYPLIVYSSIIVLSIIILLYMIFIKKEKNNIVTLNIQKKYIHVFICFCITIFSYFIITFIGFYFSMFIMMILIIIYLSYVNNIKIKFKYIIHTVFSSFIAIILEYICFSVLLKVSTPSGIFL